MMATYSLAFDYKWKTREDGVLQERVEGSLLQEVCMRTPGVLLTEVLPRQT